MNTGRAGRANNRNFCHDAVSTRARGLIVILGKQV